jgi:high affinity Mn2+ porin
LLILGIGKEIPVRFAAVRRVDPKLRPQPSLANGGAFVAAGVLLRTAFARRRHARVDALLLTVAACALLRSASPATAADLPPTYPVKARPVAAGYDWTGLYVGSHIGYAFGRSNWLATPMDPALPANVGAFNLYVPMDHFSNTGSFFEGLQIGYDRMLANRLLFGLEADLTFPAFLDRAGLSIGGTSDFVSPVFGPGSFSETVLSSGTVRGRFGYAPGSWLFYASGGLAWTYNRQVLSQDVAGTVETAYPLRVGWAVGGGVEKPIAPNWTARGEYLWTGYPSNTTNFNGSAYRIGSDFSVHQLRLGLNYRFDGDAIQVARNAAPAYTPLNDIVSIHGQTTFVEQAHPSFRSPYQGTNSMPGSPEARQTLDITLFAGIKLWQGAEFWANPEIDQGFGFANTHGAAGFPSAEAYKIGSATPYARIQRAFLRQTVNLGGDTEKLEADANQFAGTRKSDRVVLTVGRFGINDIFDTNKYANNPKADFLNWSVINAGTFDYAGDGWGFNYGAAAEWYQGRWTLRAGIFDLSASPAGGVSPLGGSLDPTFQQFQMLGEIEERHELWGQPGKIKVTGFLSRGRAGAYTDAIALAQATGLPADITAVRTYRSRPGVSLNIEQQVTDQLGVFARAGWADPNVEPWDFTDIDRTVSGGISLSGKSWGRPDDTVGIAGVINGISNNHIAFLNAGGLGILVGDGQLTNPKLEKIFEAYYSYAVLPSTKLTFDYQFIANPAYNADRGPVNAFAGRVHWQF